MNPHEKTPEEALAQHYLSEVRARYRSIKRQGEGALEQLQPEDFTHSLDPEANSIAIILRHLHGNMLSRWTDFLTSDGEKPWRERDEEFREGEDTPERLMQLWEEGWTCALEAIDALTPADLLRSITIRGEAHTVLQALERQTVHYAGHVGQVVLLAKHLRGSAWRTLSIPKAGH